MCDKKWATRHFHTRLLQLDRIKKRDDVNSATKLEIDSIRNIAETAEYLHPLVLVTALICGFALLTMYSWQMQSYQEWCCDRAGNYPCHIDHFEESKHMLVWNVTVETPTGEIHTSLEKLQFVHTPWVWSRNRDRSKDGFLEKGCTVVHW